jgi:Tol biopolymer transport system component
MRKYLILYALISLFASCLFAAIADKFYYVGNEKTVITDPQTGRQIIYLTRTDCMNTSFYPHNRGWAEDNNYLLFESDRPRPNGEPSTGDGSDYRHIERQLMAVNVNTGDVYWLAPLEAEDTSQYGANHVPMSSQFHADYAPQTNMILYNDMTGHRLYTLNLNTGENKMIWRMEGGTLGDPTSISWDGQTAAVYTASPKPSDSMFFDGRTTSLFKLNINPQTGELLGEPVLIYSYANRVDHTNDGSINLSHAIVDPMEPSRMMFSHGYVGGGDGSVQKNRIWYAELDGSRVSSLVTTPAGYADTHELWGFKAKYAYFVRIVGAQRSLQQVDVATGELETIFSSSSLKITHMSVDASETLFTFDTFDTVIDSYNRQSTVHLYNKQTDTLTKLASLPTGINHPRHSHPVLSPDGSKVAFVAATGNDDSAVALIELD